MASDPDCKDTTFLSRISHTRTVVRECCKGDDANQWGNQKFDPFPRPNPQPIVNKNRIRHWVLDIYPHTKFSHDPLRGFFSPYARNCASKMFTIGFFFGFLQRPRAEAPEQIFTHSSNNQTTRFHAMMCLFGDRKQKFNI